MTVGGNPSRQTNLACSPCGIYDPCVSRWLRAWRERHRHPISLILHVAAIPLIPAAGLLAAAQWLEGAWSPWWRPVGLLIVSYALQWVGHRMEGNDMGEWIVIRKMFGKSHTAVSPKIPATSTVRDSPRGSELAES